MTQSRPREQQLLQHHPRCFGCGAANAGGLQLAVRWDGSQAVLEHRPPADSEGGPGVVHGGYIGALVDEVMALVASEHLGGPAMTRRIELDLRAPTPIERPLLVRSWVEESGRRRIVTRLVATSEGQVCFEAKGLFLDVPRKIWLRQMQAAGRGPDGIEWQQGDSSTFLRWQMNGGLQAVFCAQLLPRPVQVAVVLSDVRPAEWTITADPHVVKARLGVEDGWDVRFTGQFRPWQQLLRRTVPLAELLASPGVAVEGDRALLAQFAAALDFGRYA